MSKLLYPVFAGLLVVACTKPDQPHKYGELVQATKEGDFGRVKRLLEEGVSPNATSADGQSALATASRTGNKQLVSLLMGGGLFRKAANVNARDNDGETALHGAARAGRLDIVTLLLDGGADPNIRSASGVTALWYACALGHWDVITLLLGKTSDVNARGPDGSTALIHVLRGLATRRDLAPNPDAGSEIVKPLLDKGTDVHAKTTDGEDALWWAAWGGSWRLVELLLDKGANANSIIADGRLVGRLGYNLKTGESAIQWVRAKNGTALVAALFNGNEDVVRLLISRGADVKNIKTVINGVELSAIGVAGSQRHDNLITLLRGAGAN